MAQFRITPAVVREEFNKFIGDLYLHEDEGKEAEKTLAYIAGACHMARAIIARYEGGNEN